MKFCIKRGCGKLIIFIHTSRQTKYKYESIIILTIQGGSLGCNELWAEIFFFLVNAQPLCKKLSAQCVFEKLNIY